MGQSDNAEENYETRELAWELTQEHKDSGRIRFLIDTGADVRHAFQLAKLNEKDVLKNPLLRPLNLGRYLQPEMSR
jgi:hypothetical protein